MPLYEFRCRTCGSTFEERRPMSESGATATCPSGHVDAVRMLSVFANVGSSVGAPAQSRAPQAGCCGGGCCS